MFSLHVISVTEASSTDSTVPISRLYQKLWSILFDQYLNIKSQLIFQWNLLGHFQKGEGFPQRLSLACSSEN